MKLRLIELLRCPVCRSSFRLESPVVRSVDRAPAPELAQCRGLCPFPERMGLPRDCSACTGYEVIVGALVCSACGQRYAIERGVPRFAPVASRLPRHETARTASSYGYLWGRSTRGLQAAGTRVDHFDVLAAALSLAPSRGLVLDAGCGDGIDLANHARRAGVEIVGVELSDGGCGASFERSLGLRTAHVVQADLSRLPFDSDAFDFIYSYGVLHHLSSPKEGLQELVRALKPGARVAAYVYEDFGERAAGWRWLLAAVNRLRGVTVRFPHGMLYRLCQAAAPLTYLLFALPYRALRRVPGLRSLMAGFPFRHATGPFSLAGDLYDRFSAPVEWRFSRAGAEALLQNTGLRAVSAVNHRGWMVSGIKPMPASR